MAEANVSQLAKLLSAVMEYEDLPVEIHNAIADWSCPNGRVTNSPELFRLMLEDRKTHPEDYEGNPKISHPVYPGEGPKLVVLAEKEPAEEMTELQRQHAAEKLGVELCLVLQNPVLPSLLREGIWSSLCEIETRSDTLNSDYFRGLFLLKPRQAEAEGGAA